MNDINLLSDKVIRRKRILFKKATRTIFLIIVCLVLTSLLAIKPIQRIILEGKINEISKNTDNNVLDEINAVEKKIAGLEKAIQKIENNYEAFSFEGTAVSQLITDIASMMPETLKVKEFTYKEESYMINMEMESSERMDISLFLIHLYNSGKYFNIEISKIMPQSEVFIFSVSMTVDCG